MFKYENLMIDNQIKLNYKIIKLNLSKVKSYLHLFGAGDVILNRYYFFVIIHACTNTNNK
jgi:hypothetical protein